jgi:hypothetical protein
VVIDHTTGDPDHTATMPMVIAVAPLLIAVVASAWIVVGWAAGGSPFWPDPQLTLSEAAGLGNAGEVVRLITIEGRDPNRAWPVREDILGPAQEITPLEAAVAIRRTELIPVLLRHGAVLPERGEQRTALICRAQAAVAPAIVELLLKTGDGSDPRAACDQESP